MKKRILLILILFSLFLGYGQVFSEETTEHQCITKQEAKKINKQTVKRHSWFKRILRKGKVTNKSNLNIEGIRGIGKPAIYLYTNGNSTQQQDNCKIPIGRILGTQLGAKPAIYLYPPGSLKVNIIMDKSIVITYDAPKYVPEKGWNVLAFFDGRVQDLQSEYTDCEKLDTNKFGLEYAKKACQANNYPYVFWEGYSTKLPLPQSKQGWIVSKSELSQFLAQKLDYIGFNKAEKDEFLD